MPAQEKLNRWVLPKLRGALGRTAGASPALEIVHGDFSERLSIDSRMFEDSVTTHVPYSMS